MKTRRMIVVAAATVLATLAGADGGPGSGTRYTSTDALDLLMAGNVRYSSGMPEHRNTGAARIAETSTGQAPFAVVLTCADSRVPAELVFDRGIGDIFVVRVAGNTSGPFQAGSIEYAVEHLGSPLIVVMGHSGCGAVKAAASGGDAHGNIGAILAPIAPAIAEARTRSESTGDDLTETAVRCNVMRSISDLIVSSPAIAAQVEGGAVRLVGAVYDISTGRVEWLGQHPQQAAMIARAKEIRLAPEATTEHADAAPDASPSKGESAKPTKASATRTASKPSENRGEPRGDGKPTKASSHAEAHDDGHH